MKAYGPNGVPIIGTSDLIPGNALIADFNRRDPDGSLSFEWAGDTDVCYDGQMTQMTNDWDRVGPALLEAAREAWAELMDTPVGAKLLDAIDAFNRPAQAIYVDENGYDVPESEIVLEDELFNCCTGGVAPDWTQFKSLEIGGCRDEGGNTIGLLPDDKAEFWTIYARHHSGEAEAITDCKTREQAEKVLRVLAAISGLPAQ
jgi:hypothetical protein